MELWVGNNMKLFSVFYIAASHTTHHYFSCIYIVIYIYCSLPYNYLLLS